MVINIFKKNKKNRKKVFLGMSGGVDSSVSALKLLDAGYDVTGVFIKVWQPDFFECTWKQDRRDAMRVAAKLNIPFITLNAEKEYKENVVDYMVDEYKNGRTPNPDVMCNNSVKFGVFYKKAMEMGADFIATGHYAKKEYTESGPKLMIPKDKNKDQTYFLWNISIDSLDKTIFPLHDLNKEEVREIARDNNLFTAEKSDSQGLCFVGEVSMKDFLKQFLELQSGAVLDKNRDVIGHHNGAILYTVGQRHGFEITKKSPDQEKLFVIEKDIENNTITVGVESDIKRGEIGTTNKIILDHINELSNFPDTDLLCRIRYRGNLEKCSITKNGTDLVVDFKKEQRGVAEGQSAVFYHKDICLGGGIIKKVK